MFSSDISGLSPSAAAAMLVFRARRRKIGWGRQGISSAVVLHLTILFGGFGVQALGSPVWALLLLVGLKTAIDLYAHLKEHRPAGATTQAPP